MRTASISSTWVFELRPDRTVRLLCLVLSLRQRFGRNASGTVTGAEEEILDRVLHLDDRTVAAIMTPRTDIKWVDVSADAATLAAAFATLGHSRLVACEGSVEHVLGVLEARDVVVHCLGDSLLDVRALLRQPLFIPGSMPLLELLTRFRKSEVQTAIILDEFGGVEGLVTLDAILANLVADLPGRGQAGEGDLVRRDDGSWLIDGATPIDAVDEALDIERPAAERRRGYRTLAGFIMTEQGRLPAVGERVEGWGYTFEVVDMDGRRIDRVLVSLASARR